MKRTVRFTLCCLGAIALLCSCGGRNTSKSDAAEQTAADSLAAAKEQTIMQQVAALPDEPVFDIVTNFGTIRVKLYSGTPKHRENFAKLALSGFYDGILFHRVINGFMIQTGDPLSKDEAQKSQWGTGGPGYQVPAEIRPEYFHRKGALAAARRGDAGNPLRESSGSQFYIVQDEAACMSLDGAYTVFGETVEGLDVIDAIAAVQTDQRDCPLETVKIITVKSVESE